MKCEVCGHRARKQLDQHLLFRHFMTVIEYRKRYGKKTRI